MKPAHILIIEDEENLANTIALNLQLENHKTTIQTSGKEALDFVNQSATELDLILLDVMLPGINGFDLCRKFKLNHPKLPVIFITAKNQSSDKIAGLKLGADDYIVKPFELEELLLRIANIIKRSKPEQSPLFVFGQCRINFETFEIIDIRNEKLTLSKREIGLLKLLTSNINKVISRDEIIDQLWESDENASSRTIDNFILGFRKYFEENPKKPVHFHSIRGVGYKFTLN
jgi:two-component system alkaline phosphatase synthesis response regulator PhoP